MPPFTLNRQAITNLANAAQQRANTAARNPAAQSNVYFYQGVGLDPQMRRMYLFTNLPSGTYAFGLAAPVYGMIHVQPAVGRVGDDTGRLDGAPLPASARFVLTAEQGYRVLLTMPANSTVEPTLVRVGPAPRFFAPIESLKIVP